MHTLFNHAYIVSLGLTEPSQRYEPLYAVLRQSPKWFNYMSGTWIVVRQETLVDFAAKIRPLIFTNDRLLVMPAKGPGDGWLPKDAWDWINNEVPREW